MTTRRRFLFSGGAVTALAALGGWRALASALGLRAADAATPETFAVMHSDAQWHRLLDPQQYAVLREAATERPYSSPLNDEHRAGMFHCAGCRTPCFSSSTKFDSRTGWPSFWAPVANAVGDRDDHSWGVTRTEIHCARCGGHLGHRFSDGPAPTGLRYCMNGFALGFTAGAA
ncbi:peptide-methionine (R)-S-oxide reductase MsrB [Robbsia sp. Bb-Pol-6]|uniref:peptide-methionine (R)-S-oxide reductase n=1 Tax=Robbsia betulipollinis TaxID=2981849 RepID=A0ABT3ZGZ5_9BURK|nr:peptide-methionine (R)-S-oxide reductase MsrB [Robbsia betulipollinis]MCY0385794.1 peptide-methionine (R)-S-oxide reductase MsrB [Robbsia betulipollinis]